jgi:hypothetical protein
MKHHHGPFRRELPLPKSLKFAVAWPEGNKFTRTGLESSVRPQNHSCLQSALNFTHSGECCTFCGVEVRYVGTVNRDEVAEIEAWADGHRSDVDHVTIGLGAVAVYRAAVGRDSGISAVAIRHPGRLTAALDEALANLNQKN